MLKLIPLTLLLKHLTFSCPETRSRCIEIGSENMADLEVHKF